MPPAKTLNTEMTSAEKRAYVAYKRWIGTYSAPPSFQQLATALGVTKNAAVYLVRKLEARGLLRSDAKTGRFAINKRKSV
jgi:DNA-binding MarR family transcriptional regulator